MTHGFLRTPGGAYATIDVPGATSTTPTDITPGRPQFRFRFCGSGRSGEDRTNAGQAGGGRIPERFRLDPIRDVQVLCPMNRGSLGVRELNTALQQVLNPAKPGQASVERFGWRFQIGDKVIQTENDYDKDVFNGDIGIVERIDAVEQEVAVRFDERLVKHDFGELDEIALAYAITIHKSQGSEFPAVVIPLATQHYMLLQLNLVYTGTTRGQAASGADWAAKGTGHSRPQ
jgi:ATP-dependent exoDNAse (exonuclease V) alpha subunit